MDDGIAAGKRRERLRPQQAMGIGNRANGSHHARPAYKRSRMRREPRAMGSATDKRPSMQRRPKRAQEAEPALRHGLSSALLPPLALRECRHSRLADSITRSISAAFS